MPHNPFKYGSIVEGPFFTNRVHEARQIKAVLSSRNHLIIISPQRYGKKSLICRAVSELNRPLIGIDLQLITTPADLAGQLLKRINRAYTFGKLKQFIKQFRIAPNISFDSLTNDIDVSFKLPPSNKASEPLEDVLNLAEKLASSKNKSVILFSEFQEIKRIGRGLDSQLRSIMGHHKKINYVFLGSREPLIREIFEGKKSSFYNFGYLFPLGKIPEKDFLNYLTDRFKKLTPGVKGIPEAILNITNSKPYYTQQLAFAVWEVLDKGSSEQEPVKAAAEEIIRSHDIEYERLWSTLNRTDMTVLIGMAFSRVSPLSTDFPVRSEIGSTSTIFSSLKRLLADRFLSKSEKGYEIDDPFFKMWIVKRRSG